MKLLFAGTRGEIDQRTDRHRRHSALLVEYRRYRVMVDCGADWTDAFQRLNPHAFVITHAHPDHAWGLKHGAQRPVYATEAAWRDLVDYPIERRRTVVPREPFTISDIDFEAFEVEHSTRCPAVSYRIRAGRVTIHYAPDVVYIHDRTEALKYVRLYIGDGASPDRALVRKQGERLIGHAAIRTQLTWCGEEGVGRALFTHCGSRIVGGDERTIGARIRRWGSDRGVDAGLAHDGLELILR